MAKVGMMVTYLEGFLDIKSRVPLTIWSTKITRKTKTIIFQLPVSIATKPGRMVTYLQGLLAIKSHDHLIT